MIAEKWLKIYMDDLGIHTKDDLDLHHVRDASPTQTYSFLPASWASNTHEETDVLPIGDQEEKGGRLLNRRTDRF